MPMSRETAREVDAAAAAWAARADRGLTDSEAAELETWLAGDPRRPGAYARLTWTLMSTEKAAALAPGGSLQPARDSRGPELTRRRWLIGGGAIAASAAGVMAWGVLGAGTAYATRKGEMRVVNLDDGSILTLNTASRVMVRYTQSRRTVRLEHGEALFEVARDPQRPFVVEAGATEVRAVGTTFSVTRLESAPVGVLVREGAVDVVRRDAPTDQPARVLANMRALAAPAAPGIELAAVNAAAAERELAWREGRLAFEGEALAEAADRFGRYSDLRIVVDDPDLAREEIAGIFRANDPAGFAQSVALGLGARTERTATEIRIVR